MKRQINVVIVPTFSLLPYGTALASEAIANWHNSNSWLNGALDYAAYEACGENYFSETALYQGYTAWLPPPANCTRVSSMRVFGNGNNYLSIG
ncbi:MAG: hypothetical protein ACFCUE_15500 [Candidatus Bathyarchaeia archaeon]